MTYLKANDYDLIKSLDDNDIIIFAKTLEVAVEIEIIIDKEILKKDEI